MHTRSLAAALALLAVVTACGGSSGDGAATTAPAAATTTAGGTSSSVASAPTATAGSAATTAAAARPAASGLCGVFTADELSEQLGAKVADGRVSGPLGSACNWDSDDAEYVQLQAVGSDAWETRDRGIAGYRSIPELGDDAWAVPELGGWACAAQAPAGKATYLSMVGPDASADLCIALLTQAVERTS